MEEPLFPFFSEGDEHEQQHCHFCGLPLPDGGDPDVIRVPVQAESGAWRLAPACRRHWRDAQDASRGAVGGQASRHLRANDPHGEVEG